MNVRSIRENKIISYLVGVVNSDYYPFINALIFTVLYYLALDIVALYFLAISIIFTLLFVDDLTPFFAQIIYVNFVVSYQNSPSSVSGNSGYYLNPAIYVQIFVLVFLCAVAVLYRFAKAIKEKKFKFNGVSLSLIFLAGALLLGGLFSDEHSFIDIFYGFALAFFFCIINFVFNGNAKITKENIRKICLTFVALSVMLLVQLGVKYVVNFGEIVKDGAIDKSAITFGWGIWNTMSMYLVISLPPIFYLACTHERGYLYFIYAIVVFGAIFAVSSRQGMLIAFFLFPACLYMLFKYGKNKRINGIITIICACILLVLSIIFFDKVIKLFSGILTSLFNENGELSGSFRVELFNLALIKYLKFPVFGVGFSTNMLYAIEFVGLNGVIPLMFHNTIAQILSACGTVGIMAYVYHRFQTVRCFIKNRTKERTFLALSLVAFILINLFDNHIFYFFPTMIYSVLVYYATGDGENTATKEQT